MSFRDTSRRSRIPAVVMAGLLWASVASAAESLALSAPCLSLESLASMNWGELEQLYREAAPGAVPTGYARGRTIYCPCAPLTPMRSKLSQKTWHGKHFCPSDGTLINQWCLGVRAVRARVDYGESWLDGKPSIVMDYRGMSHIWRDVRDEIREVAPGLYLGLMYRCKAGQSRMKLFFVLEMTGECP